MWVENITYHDKELPKYRFNDILEALNHKLNIYAISVMEIRWSHPRILIQK